MTKLALALAVAAAALSAAAQTGGPPSPGGTLPGAPGMVPVPTPSTSSPAPKPSTSSPAPNPSTSPPAPTHPRREAVERGTVLEDVAGKVAEIDRKEHRLRVETATGPVTLSLDRNTMVYTSNGLGTMLDVTPGAQIRAGRNADFLAYWVQVRTAPAQPASTPGQGTGPAGGGSAAASESVGPGAGAAPSPPTTGAGPGTGGTVGTSPP